MADCTLKVETNLDGSAIVEDWEHNIDVAGFCFLDLTSNYVLADSLVKWIKGGRKPIYIGFSSLTILEPDEMTQAITQAPEITDQRGIISKGWGSLGNLAEPADFIYLVDKCPHNWLFFQYAAVAHHGGAGTSVAGTKLELYQVALEIDLGHLRRRKKERRMNPIEKAGIG
ncbi:sterol 3-beta-glucosyltransferase UGT80A2-like [Diospyros lotus]|uniref:sterol 3-beta-glucosyltransferase UGT80A2-like n=1 Tax=Diospyros lotus TaxID=55363 RepID=UPI00225C32C4|nr:sterol 3-beta-glucosyltransferase UGT80A2-like [Diospyros lotus]